MVLYIIMLVKNASFSTAELLVSLNIKATMAPYKVKQK